MAISSPVNGISTNAWFDRPFIISAFSINDKLRSSNSKSFLRCLPPQIYILPLIALYKIVEKFPNGCSTCFRSIVLLVKYFKSCIIICLRFGTNTAIRLSFEYYSKLRSA